jgi:hypothetical protein
MLDCELPIYPQALPHTIMFPRSLRAAHADQRRADRPEKRRGRRLSPRPDLEAPNVDEPTFSLPIVVLTHS